MTLEGLDGSNQDPPADPPEENDFTPYEGETELAWVSDCTWRDSEVGHMIDLTYSITGWEVTLLPRGSCEKIWQTTTQSKCDPTVAYDEYSCSEGGCNDGGSCVESTGATCSVSETPA